MPKSWSLMVDFSIFLKVHRLAAVDSFSSSAVSCSASMSSCSCCWKWYFLHFTRCSGDNFRYGGHVQKHLFRIKSGLCIPKIFSYRFIFDGVIQKIKRWSLFTVRAMLCAVYAMVVCMSVCMCVCLCVCLSLSDSWASCLGHSVIQSLWPLPDLQMCVPVPYKCGLPFSFRLLFTV